MGDAKGKHRDLPQQQSTCTHPLTHTHTRLSYQYHHGFLSLCLIAATNKLGLLLVILPQSLLAEQKKQEERERERRGKRMCIGMYCMYTSSSPILLFPVRISEPTCNNPENGDPSSSLPTSASG